MGWFCAYLVNPAYGWQQVCLERFGEVPIQICHEGNAVKHVLESETDPRVRPFTREELQRFFDFADDRVAAAAGSHRKGWLTAFRDSIILKFLYGYGLRRTEGLRVDTVDFHRTPAAPEFDQFGSCAVRYGKSSRGGPPKRRTVLTVFPWVVEVLQEYLEDVRPLFEPDGDMLFPTERGGRVSGAYLNARFGHYRDAIGLPRELHLHCLRHSYVTHLMEDGYDPFFVQQQVGTPTPRLRPCTRGSQQTSRTRRSGERWTVTWIPERQRMSLWDNTVSTRKENRCESAGLRVEPTSVDGAAGHVRHDRSRPAASRAGDHPVGHAGVSLGHR